MDKCISRQDSPKISVELTIHQVYELILMQVGLYHLHKMKNIPEDLDGELGNLSNQVCDILMLLHDKVVELIGCSPRLTGSYPLLLDLLENYKNEVSNGISDS
jgi:hypothetical protein